MSNPYEYPSARQEPNPERMSAAEILGHVQPQPMTQASTSTGRNGSSWVVAVVLAVVVFALLGGAYLMQGNKSNTGEPAAPPIHSEVHETSTREKARATSLRPRPSTENAAPSENPTSAKVQESTGSSWGSPRN